RLVGERAADLRVVHGRRHDVERGALDDTAVGAGGLAAPAAAERDGRDGDGQEGESKGRETATRTSGADHHGSGQKAGMARTPAHRGVPYTFGGWRALLEVARDRSLTACADCDCRQSPKQPRRRRAGSASAPERPWLSVGSRARSKSVARPASTSSIAFQR